MTKSARLSSPWIPSSGPFVFLHSLSQFELFVLDSRLPVEKGLGTTCFENRKLKVIIDRDRPSESCAF